MKSDFDASAAIQHRGGKGSARERILLDFLHKYLPENVRASGSAEIVATNGETSGQMDIVIHDPKVPPLYDNEGHRILPVECVYAVIEVKSRLDARELAKSRASITKVKRMPKTAFFPQMYIQRPTVYGRQYEGYFPTFGYIFAYDSNDLRSMIDIELLKSLALEPYDERLDALWVLGKGVCNWVHPVTHAPGTNSEPGLYFGIGDAGEHDVLINLVLTVCTVMAQVFMPPFNFITYAADATFSDNTVLRGPLDYPGPLQPLPQNHAAKSLGNPLGPIEPN
jgi:hypothetical protein